jgi:hypothetical protein
MAKGSANEKALGALHMKITAVFQKVLSRYEARLDAVDTVDPSQIEDDVLRELLADGAMPNPAMLSAITKFLKDNSISFDNEQITELSDQERRLAERREKRGNIVDLSTLKVQHG